MATYYAIGIMSGSSLDGVDLAYCEFDFLKNNWNFKILKSANYPLVKWVDILKNTNFLNAKDLQFLDNEFGNFLGKVCQTFIKENGISRIDLIASHGHTIFHHPELGFTCQVGNGNAIAQQTCHKVVADFRGADIAAGGQGAPIVPIGDLHLFKEYSFCLNIGGIANLSFKNKETIIAFDICSANQVLNYYAQQKGKEYDKNGALAKKGKIHKELLASLNEIEYYKQAFPKSLDNSFSKKVIDIIEDYPDLTVEDKLATFVEHIAFQINKAVKSCGENLENENLLITGGGAFNLFLIERIKANTKLKVILPKSEIINYKEALVMAFMGVLRIRNEVNCLASVTGASKNTICGAIFEAV